MTIKGRVEKLEKRHAQPARDFKYPYTAEQTSHSIAALVDAISEEIKRDPATREAFEAWEKGMSDDDLRRIAAGVLVPGAAEYFESMPELPQTAQPAYDELLEKLTEQS